MIPVLLLRDEALVKTRQFGRFTYVGDPCNTARIFNDLEVDELLFLDILATRRSERPNLKLLAEIASECFMPVSYGGGIRDIDVARSILSIGIEKIVLNSYAVENPAFITDLARDFGSQAVVVSMDVRSDWLGRNRVWSHGGRRRTGLDPAGWARRVQDLGAGEIIATCIDREGTWVGFDLQLMKSIADAVTIPVVAHGGCGSVSDAEIVVSKTGSSAVGVGSMVVFQKRGKGVLVNFPTPAELASLTFGGACQN